MITLCKYLKAINTKGGSFGIRLDVIGRIYGQKKLCLCKDIGAK